MTGAAQLAELSSYQHEYITAYFDSKSSDETDGQDYVRSAALDGANCITSEIKDSTLHTVALDLDVPARLVPSSTPGHSHLYIDVPMSKQMYIELLEILALAGVIEYGYFTASRKRGFTSLRLPWVKK